MNTNCLPILPSNNRIQRVSKLPKFVIWSNLTPLWVLWIQSLCFYRHVLHKLQARCYLPVCIITLNKLFESETKNGNIQDILVNPRANNQLYLGWQNSRNNRTTSDDGDAELLNVLVHFKFVFLENILNCLYNYTGRLFHVFQFPDVVESDHSEVV